MLFNERKLKGPTLMIFKKSRLQALFILSSLLNLSSFCMEETHQSIQKEERTFQELVGEKKEFGSSANHVPQSFYPLDQDLMLLIFTFLPQKDITTLLSLSHSLNLFGKAVYFPQKHPEERDLVWHKLSFPTDIDRFRFSRILIHLFSKGDLENITFEAANTGCHTTQADRENFFEHKIGKMDKAEEFFIGVNSSPPTKDIVSDLQSRAKEAHLVYTSNKTSEEPTHKKGKLRSLMSRTLHLHEDQANEDVVPMFFLLNWCLKQFYKYGRFYGQAEVCCHLKILDSSNELTDAKRYLEWTLNGRRKLARYIDSLRKCSDDENFYYKADLGYFYYMFNNLSNLSCELFDSNIVHHPESITKLELLTQHNKIKYQLMPEIDAQTYNLISPLFKQIHIWEYFKHWKECMKSYHVQSNQNMFAGPSLNASTSSDSTTETESDI